MAYWNSWATCLRYLLKNKQLRALLALLLTSFWAHAAQSDPVTVEVLGADGRPVPDVAVFVTQSGAELAAPPATAAVMDQVDTRFVPHILMVQTGTSVEFPNSDVIAHHVYSFSKPNNFVLPLYKGDAHDPVTFAHDGVVTLGCNIHDEMLGYIVVVDTDVFGKTDETGRIQLALDDGAGGYEVRIWSPRIRDDAAALTQSVAASSGAGAQVSFKLQKKLRAPHHSQTDGAQWSEY